MNFTRERHASRRGGRHERCQLNDECRELPGERRDPRIPGAQVRRQPRRVEIPVSFAKHFGGIGLGVAVDLRQQMRADFPFVPNGIDFLPYRLDQHGPRFANEEMISRKQPCVKTPARMFRPRVQFVHFQVLFRGSGEGNDWAIEWLFFAKPIGLGQSEICMDLRDEHFSQLGTVQDSTDMIAVVLPQLLNELLFGQRRNRSFLPLHVRRMPAHGDEEERLIQSPPSQLPYHFESDKRSQAVTEDGVWLAEIWLHRVDDATGQIGHLRNEGLADTPFSPGQLHGQELDAARHQMCGPAAKLRSTSSCAMKAEETYRGFNTAFVPYQPWRSEIDHVTLLSDAYR